MEWAIGVDGGGTHTRAAIVDATGVVRGVRIGGAAIFNALVQRVYRTCWGSYYPL